MALGKAGSIRVVFSFALVVGSTGFANDVPYRGKALQRRSTVATTPAATKASPAKAKAKATRIANRVPANADYGSLRTNGDVQRNRTKDWSLNLSVLGGFATTSTNVTSAQAQRDAANFGNNGYAGGAVDFRLGQYAGVEAEGFYNFAPTGSITSLDRFNGRFEKEEKRLRQYGAMGNLKGRLPFKTGSVRWEPSLGGGFGTVGIREASTLGSSGATTDTNTNIYGFYAVAGLEVEPIRGLIVSADYARSLGASGERSGSTTANLTNARFDRLRASTVVRIDNPFYVGLQYSGRRLNFDLPGTSSAAQEKLDQYLGVLMLGF